MNDNTLRGPQWQKLIGEYMVPRYGGEAKRWGEANRMAVERIIQRIYGMYDEEVRDIPENYYQGEAEVWVETMFSHMDLPMPKNPVDLSESVSRWITPRVKSSYPGMIELLHELATDYDLYTASNEVSYELRGYLKGMGVDQHFSRFFGPDLVGAFKSSPLYYERIIELTGINPRHSLVIDDKLKNLNHAASLGFNVLHSGREGQPPGKYPHFVTTEELRELIVNYPNVSK